MSESPALPYFEVEKLSRECKQIIEKHFRRLRHAWVWPHSRATLTLFEDRFQFDFADSRTSVECAIDPRCGRVGDPRASGCFELALPLVGKDAPGPLPRSAGGNDGLRICRGLLSRKPRRPEASKGKHK